MKRASLGWLLCAALWLATTTAPAAIAQGRDSPNSLLKAAFLFNFAKFTYWPEPTWGSKDAPLTLCTIGDDALVRSLPQLGGHTVQGHPVTILSLARDADTKPCQLLYLAHSEQGLYHHVLKDMVDAPVLTISELTNFAASGGGIELYQQGEHLRFIINLEATRRAGLTLSARLLAMAQLIGQQQP